MKRHEQTREDGAALLFVLAAIALVVPATVGLARAVATARVSRNVERTSRLADQVLDEVEAPIVDWLVHDAGDVVLPPTAKCPAVEVLAETTKVDGTTVELHVVAWDQCGLVPLELAHGASSLRLALPDEVRVAVDRVKAGRERPGLDWFAAEDAHSPFPATVPRQSPRVRFLAVDAVDRDATVGAWVATHSNGRLNVSTAPIPLVEAALRDAGRGGLEAIVAARAEGRAVPVPSGKRDEKQNERSIDFTSRSDVWAFRIDVTVARTARSWWAVYRPTESSSSAGWRCVQRLAIPD